MEMNQKDQTPNHSGGAGNWSDSIATEFVDQNWYNPTFGKQPTNVIQESVTSMLIPQNQNHIPHQQVTHTLKGPNSVDQQNQILHHLKNNPQMMSTFTVQQKQQSSMNGAGDPMGSNQIQQQPRLQHMQHQHQVHYYQQQCQQQFQGHSEMVANAQIPQQYGVAGGPAGPISVEDTSMEHNRAYEQLLDSLKRATSVAQQKKILQTLRSNPSLMAVYLKRNKQGNEFHEGRVEPMSHSQQHEQQASMRPMVHQQQSIMRPMIPQQQVSMQPMFPQQQSSMGSMPPPQQASMRPMAHQQQSIMHPMIPQQKCIMRPMIPEQQAGMRPMFPQQQQKQQSPKHPQYQQHQFQPGMETNGRMPQAGLVCKENLSMVPDEAYQQLVHIPKSPKIRNQNQQVQRNLKSSPAVVSALLKHRKKSNGQNSGGAGSLVASETEKQDPSVQRPRLQQQMQQQPNLNQVHQQQQMQQPLHQSLINQGSVVKAEPVNQINSEQEQNRAHQKLKAILTSPNTPERQNHILRLVKSNPSLMAVFAKRRQQLDQKDGFLPQDLQSTQGPNLQQQQPAYTQQQQPAYTQQQQLAYTQQQQPAYTQQQQPAYTQQQHPAYTQHQQPAYTQQQHPPQHQHQQHQYPSQQQQQHPPQHQQQQQQHPPHHQQQQHQHPPQHQQQHPPLHKQQQRQHQQQQQRQYQHQQQQQLPEIGDTPSMQNQASHNLRTLLNRTSSPGKINQITHPQQKPPGIGDVTTTQNRASHHLMTALKRSNSPGKMNQITYQQEQQQQQKEQEQQQQKQQQKEQDQQQQQQKQQCLEIKDTSSMQNKAPHQPPITCSPEKINQTTNVLQSKPQQTAVFEELHLELDLFEPEAYSPLSSSVDQQLMDMQEMLQEQLQKQEEQHKKKLQEQQQKQEQQKREQERKKKTRKDMEIYSVQPSSQADQNETFSDSSSSLCGTRSPLDYGNYIEDCSLNKKKPPSPMQELMKLVEDPSPIFSPESNASPESPRNHSLFSPAGGPKLSPYQYAYRPSLGNQKSSLDHELHIPSEMMPAATPERNDDISEILEMATQELQNFVNGL